MTLGSSWNSFRPPPQMYGPRDYNTGQAGVSNQFDQNKYTNARELNRQSGPNQEGDIRDQGGVYLPNMPPEHQPIPTPQWSAPYGAGHDRNAETYIPPARRYAGDAGYNDQLHIGTEYLPAPKIPRVSVGTGEGIHGFWYRTPPPGERYPYDQWAMRTTGAVPAPDHGLLRAPPPVLSRAPRLFYDIQVREAGRPIYTFIGAKAPTPRDGFNASLSARTPFAGS